MDLFDQAFSQARTFQFDIFSVSISADRVGFPDEETVTVSATRGGSTCRESFPVAQVLRNNQPRELLVTQVAQRLHKMLPSKKGAQPGMPGYSPMVVPYRRPS